MDKLSSFTLLDLVGAGLGFMAVALTIVALAMTLLIFFMGRRYSDHMSEVESARRDLSDMIKKIQSDTGRNESMIDELHLGFYVITGLVHAEANLRQIESLPSESGIDPEKMKIERAKLITSVRSREAELRIMAVGGKNCSATLNGVARTLGDQDSIKFFDRFIEILEKRNQPQRSVIEARSVTYARLVDEGRIG